MKILVYGSLNIDYTYAVAHFVQSGETLSSASLQKFSGGKGLNQSTALAKAGAPVCHAGAVGTDGLFLTEQLQAAGADASLVRVMPEISTGHAIIQVNPSGQNCILLYGGANQEITPELMDEVLAHFEEGDLLLMQNEISNPAYLMKAAHEKGMKLILNPSPMNETILDCPLELVDLFILNEVEAAQLLNQPEADTSDAMAVKAFATALSGHFPSAQIVLTLGARGSVYTDGSTYLETPIYPVTAVDTTAAGDTYTGYFLQAYYFAGLSAAQAMQRASAASAIAVSRKGAAPSIPAAEEVDAFLAK